MTIRLYYTDPYAREFDATITRVEHRDAHTIVTLDQTCFYPTSGGQPFDTGTLGGSRVVDVVDADDGSIAHVLDDAGARLTRGDRVHGTIAWSRRFDHMQQHTGQHMLSAAFDRLFGARTVSFHLGALASTIDLDRELTPRDITAAEDEANRIAWEDRPVAIRFASDEEAARLPLRRQAPREGPLRLIDIDGFDLSACGGTHVARTGAVGVITVAAWERFKGGQRLEFLCGGRALGRVRLLRDTVASSVRLVSVLPAELPAAIEKLQAYARTGARTIAALERDLARYRAGELAASAEVTSGARLVVRVVDGDAETLKMLAAALVSAPGFVVVLVSNSRPALVVVARSADERVRANEVIRSLTARFGGRGGGRPELAQAGGLDAAPDEILTAARALVDASG